MRCQFSGGLKNCKGYLMLTAAMIIVVFSLLSLLLVHMSVGTNVSQDHLQAANKALSAAESGLQDGQTQMLMVQTKPLCASLNVSYTGSASGDRYQVTGLSNPSTPTFSTLQSDINTSVTSLTLANSANFAPAGRIIIDREFIDYSRNDTASNTLYGLIRGADSTYGQAHSSGAIVSQYQCMLNAAGNSSEAAVQLRQGAQMPIAWIVGDAKSDTELSVYRWNQPQNSLYDGSGGSTTSAYDINAVSLLGYGAGWAVGEGGRVYRYGAGSGGGLWGDGSQVVGAYDGNLRGVWTVSSTEAWAVGNRVTNSRYGILHYNGSSWCRIGDSGCTYGIVISEDAQNLYDIQMVQNGSLGVAVGGSDNVAVALLYFGSSVGWIVISPDPSLLIGRLWGVAVMQGGEAWAVGRSAFVTNGRIIRLNLSSSTDWSISLSIGTSNTVLRSISMLDLNEDGFADYGWAVGENRTAYWYNGTSWASGSSMLSGCTTSGSDNFSSVVLWGKGNGILTTSNGKICFWDPGEQRWILRYTISGSPVINDVDIVAPITQPQSGWVLQAQ